MKPITLWMCLQVKWLVSKTSSNRELISDRYGTESGTTALRHKNTSRQKSRFVPFGRVLHLFDGILRFFLWHNLFPKNVCYNPNISASTSRHLDCKMVGWYLLIVLGNMGMLGLPHMIQVVKNFASSSTIASCQAFGNETPWRKCVLWVVLPSRVVSPEKNSIWAFELKIVIDQKEKIIRWSRAVENEGLDDTNAGTGLIAYTDIHCFENHFQELYVRMVGRHVTSEPNWGSYLSCGKSCNLFQFFLRTNWFCGTRMFH